VTGGVDMLASRRLVVVVREMWEMMSSFKVDKRQVEYGQKFDVLSQLSKMSKGLKAKGKRLNRTKMPDEPRTIYTIRVIEEMQLPPRYTSRTE
jgi:hypothetical protein